MGSFGDACELRTAIFDNAVAMARKVIGSGCTVCFIGDTPDDILAARYVNAKVVAVSTGRLKFRNYRASIPTLAVAPALTC